MIRVVIAALMVSAFVACGGDGPTRNKAELYRVNATVADPSRGSITISISVASNPSESDVKEAAEAVIATYKKDYPNIIVKSYPMSADKPVLVTRSIVVLFSTARKITFARCCRITAVGPR